MGYHKRRYRRVSTGGRVIDRAWWSATKVTMFADGTWWVNSVGGHEGHERPRLIVLDGVRIDPFKNATEFQKKHGIVTVRTLPTFAPTHYGGRQFQRRSFEDRFKPVEGGLKVPR